MRAGPVGEPDFRVPTGLAYGVDEGLGAAQAIGWAEIRMCCGRTPTVLQAPSALPLSLSIATLKTYVRKVYI